MNKLFSLILFQINSKALPTFVIVTAMVALTGCRMNDVVPEDCVDKNTGQPYFYPNSAPPTRATATSWMACPSGTVRKSEYRPPASTRQGNVPYHIVNRAAENAGNQVLNTVTGFQRSDPAASLALVNRYIQLARISPRASAASLTQLNILMQINPNAAKAVMEREKAIGRSLVTRKTLRF